MAMEPSPPGGPPTRVSRPRSRAYGPHLWGQQARLPTLDILGAAPPAAGSGVTSKYLSTCPKGVQEPGEEGRNVAVIVQGRFTCKHLE